ncbi:hypothetical protein PUM48_004849 [Escherichia coli]|nr:hypothetical protein [Escherichia coli]EKP2937935.1 hypothetical protein [Escherichia coli]
MYLIELSDADMYDIVSDSEYFTATEGECSSEDEYFSANEDFSEKRHLDMSSDSGSSVRSVRSVRSVSSDSQTTSTRNYYKSYVKRSAQGIKAKWSFDETEPRSQYKLRKHIPVNASAMRNYYIWRRTVLAGHHPRDAAHMIGSQYCFKQVRQKKCIELFSIRLSVEHRVFFTINEKERVVKVLNIGGHSFS